MMLEQDAHGRQPVLTDPGEEEQSFCQRCSRPGPEQIKFRIGVSVFTVAVGIILLCLVLFGPWSKDPNNTRYVIPCLFLIGGGALQIGMFVYRKYCAPAHQGQGARNSYVPNAAAYRPNPNSQLPAVRHGEPIPQVIGQAHNYGSYQSHYASSAHVSYHHPQPPVAASYQQIPPVSVPQYQSHQIQSQLAPAAFNQGHLVSSSAYGQYQSNFVNPNSALAYPAPAQV